MADITASLVKELRDATNVSMMECKRALQEANGDIAKATLLLRERGMAIAAKKASRTAKQGLVAAGISNDATTVTLVEVNCETDFVAKNDNFKGFVATLAERAIEAGEDLAAAVNDEVTAKVVEIGENIVVRRSVAFTKQGTGGIASYIHLGGKVGVLVEVACEKEETTGQDAFKEALKDLTLHVAACSPSYLTSDEIPQEVIDTERSIYAKQVENKPKEIVQKIVEGKLRKLFFAETCLVDQPFVKEPKQTIAQLLAECGKSVGDTLAVRRFVRYQMGE